MDYEGTNFTFVAKALGCDFCDAKLELECMRRVPMPRIENFIGQYQDNSTLLNTSQPAIAFTRQGILKPAPINLPKLTPPADNHTFFTNYTTLYQTSHIAPLPKIIGNCAREASPLVPYPIDNLTSGPSEDLIYTRTLSTVCAAHNTSVIRAQSDLSTYRYEWAGNFSNIAPVPWLGAYHYSDLYMIFGTYLIAPGEISELETKTSEKMQDLFLDFVTDPMGLETNGGWPMYMARDSGEGGGGKIARFGADGEVVQYVSGKTVEGACWNSSVVYDTTP